MYRIPTRGQKFFGVRQKTKSLLVGLIRETDSNKRTSKQPLKFKNDENKFFQSDNAIGFYR
ncbi:hypothetical protein BN1088_1430010 [Sphingobacterium sp. PM2-P1-29]|nr:hypothetical protein BN1088_1430010 [Sphingobacterium sp. PM2-P1-29]